MRIPIAVWWVALCLPACDTGCDGGGGSFYSARLVVGVEPQTIAREDLPAGAIELVVRSANQAAFPLVPADPEAATRIVVQSEFMLRDVRQSSNSLGDSEARIGEMGVYIPLQTAERGFYDDSVKLYMYETPDRPITDTWRGSFEIELRSVDASTRVKVDVAPFLNPCDDRYDGPTPSEYAPNARVDTALNSSATCLDGTACVPRGTLLDRDVHSIVVAPFVISTRVQAWCDYVYGY